MKLSKFLTTLGLTTVLTVSGVNILPFASIESLVNNSKAEAAVTIKNDYVWMDMPQTGNQDDNWSCGPTSAARVINFYGHNVNRDSLVNAINKDFVIPPSFNVPDPTLRDPLRTRRVDIRTGTTPHALRDVMKRWEGDNVKLERKADFNNLLGLLRQLYDKPLQLTAYCGAINRHYDTNLFGDKINHALIVVALPDQEAEVFQFDRTKLVYHWNQWLNRLKNFQCVAAA